MNRYKKTAFKGFNLMKGINCLTYGVKCLYYNQAEERIEECIMFIHDEFINVLVVLLDKSTRKLLPLNQIQNITDKDVALQMELTAYSLKHFLVLQTVSLENYYICMNTPNQKLIIWQGLQYFIIEGIMFFQRIQQFDPFRAEAMMLFLQADEDDGKFLDSKEIIKILQKMKIKKTIDEVKKSIKQINQMFYTAYNIKKPIGFDGERLQIKSFEKLIKSYSVKTELLKIFKKYCPHFDLNHKHYPKLIQMIRAYQKPIMSAEQFVLFKKHEQLEDMSLQEAQQIIIEYNQNEGINQKANLMSFLNFCNYIFSTANSILNPQKTEIYQDMTLPLPDYYIYSSHNTYCSGNQYNQPSKTQMYEIALKKGCRCVEIDIHNGPGIPIVKHGFTLTKQVNFDDCIKTIYDSGFVNNQYPIILSFENHCDIQQQKLMAQYIQDICGHLIYRIPANHKDLKNFPSPQSLKGKIVIKGDGKLEMLKFNNQEEEKKIQISEEEQDESQQQLPQEMRKVKQKEKQKAKLAAKKNGDAQVPKGNWIKLVQLTAILNSKIDLQFMKRNMWNSSSLQQKKVTDLLKSKEQKIVEYTKRFFIRTYPAGFRFDSSNYDPTPAFNIGAHVIALNLQTPDRPNYLLHSKFLENGGIQCGYLLKPEWMRSKCKQPKYPKYFCEPLVQLTVNVWSGQKCIVAFPQQKDLKLQVYLKGNKFDEENNKKFETAAILQSGFQPQFNLECIFTIYCPDLAMVVFDIVSIDGLKVLSSIAVNYTILREGLRVAPLLGGASMKFGKGSFLLIYSKKKQLTKQLY